MSIVAPVIPSVANDQIVETFRRLTPDQVRILVLSSSRRVDLDELSRYLGLARSHVAVQRAAIRALFDIPPFEDLCEFVARTPPLADLLHLAPDHEGEPARAGCAPGRERRQKHILRAAIDDVDALARRLDANAAALRAFVALSPPGGTGSLEEEVVDVARLADEVQALASRAALASRRPRNGGVDQLDVRQLAT